MPSHLHDRHTFREHMTDRAACTLDTTMRRLRTAGLSEAELEIALEYFRALFTRILTEADALYGVYESLRLSQPGRSAAHQQWLDTQFARLLYLLEEAEAELLAGAMRRVSRGFLHAAYPRQDMFGAMRPPPRQRTWARSLWRAAKVIIWLMGLLAGFIVLLACNDVLFGGFVSASYLLVGTGLLLLMMAWRIFGLSPWGLLLPVSLVGIVVYSAVQY